jgi:hypothetical protein
MNEFRITVHAGEGLESRGLFSCFNELVSSASLYLEERAHLYFEMFSPFYGNPGENVFGIFFEQDDPPRDCAEGERAIIVQDLKRLRQAYRTYFKPILKQSFVDELNSFMKDNFGKSTLGVHLRSTDRAIDPIFPGWKPLDPETVIQDIRALLRERAFDRIFLACDQIRYRDALVDEFGGRLCSFSSQISRTEDSIHHNTDFDANTNVREAMMDALLLSKCSYLARTTSNFTIFSLAASDDLDFVDLSIKHKSVTGDAEKWLGDRGRDEVTIAIPTWKRRGFLMKSLPLYLQLPRVGEIVICDETGEDHAWLRNLIPDERIRWFVNEERLGVFRNKIQCVEKSRTGMVALIDSDNVIGKEYLDAFFEHYDPSRDDTCYLPTGHKDGLDMSQFCDFPVVDRRNWNDLFNVDAWNFFLNDGNLVVPRRIVEAFAGDRTETLGTDAIYTLKRLVESGFRLKPVPGMIYEHAVHDGSYWLQTAEESMKIWNTTDWRIAPS